VIQRVADGGALDRDRKVEGMERCRGATRPDGRTGQERGTPFRRETGWGCMGEPGRYSGRGREVAPENLIAAYQNNFLNKLGITPSLFRLLEGAESLPVAIFLLKTTRHP
jgi:hypothetical protein